MQAPTDLNYGPTAEAAQALGCGSIDFDYDAIDRAVAPTPESAKPEDAHELDAQALEGFRAALGVIVDLIIPPGGRTPPPATMGIRLIALLQLVRPEALDGKSMNEIAKETGITRAALSKVLVAYSDTFSFWARHQRSLAARKTYADVQRTQRVRRRCLREAARRANPEETAAAA